MLNIFSCAFGHLYGFFTYGIFVLKNPMDVEAWWATVHGAAKSQTQLSHFTLWLWRNIYLDLLPTFLIGLFTFSY